MAPEVVDVVPADAPAMILPPPVLCLWHANCMDGLISAALVHLFFKGNVECLAVKYGDAVPVDLMTGRHVYFVDFTFPPEQVLPHLDLVRSLTVIDHHEDAMKPWVELAQNSPPEKLAVVYDIARSGGGLVWRHFFGVEGHNRAADMPIVIQYAQEYDLSTKTFHNTDEVQSGLRFHFPPHESPLAPLADFLIKAGPEEIVELQQVGIIILAQEKKQAAAFIERHLVMQEFLGHANVPVCYMPAELANPASELIYDIHPNAPFVVLFEDNYKFGTRKYSFRSRRGVGENVSAIALRLGGNGHRHSAGATVDRNVAFA